MDQNKHSLKYLKMFETFDQVNEVRAKTISPTTAQFPKELTELVTIVMTSTENIEDQAAKLEKELADMKIKKAVVENQKKEILAMLKKVKANSVELNTILGTIIVKREPKTKMTRTSVSYKEISEAFKDYLPKTKKMEETITKITDEFTKKPEEQKWEELTLARALDAAKKGELVEEGLKDNIKGLWNKLVDFVKGIFGSLKDSEKAYSQDVDEFTKKLLAMEERYYEPKVTESKVNETLDIHNTQVKDVIKDKDNNKWNVTKTSLGGATMKNASTEEEIFKTWKEMHEFGEKVDAPKPEPKKEESKKK